MTTRKREKSWGRWEGGNQKWIKNCWEERRWGRDVPSTALVLSGWFSWTWDIPSGSSLQGLFLSNCSSCSSPLCLGRAHWGMESSFPSPAAPTGITHTDSNAGTNQLSPLIYRLAFSCHAQNPQGVQSGWDVIPGKLLKLYRDLHKIRTSPKKKE